MFKQAVYFTHPTQDAKTPFSTDKAAGTWVSGAHLKIREHNKVPGMPLAGFFNILLNHHHDSPILQP